MPPSAIWRTSLSFWAKSIDRAVSFFRASGGTGSTPWKSKDFDIFAGYYSRLPQYQSERFRAQFHLVDIAPAPVLAGFERLNDRMFRLVEMLRRVLILRR